MHDDGMGEAKPRLRDRIKSRMLSTKVAAAAAVTGFGAALAAVPDRAAAADVGTTTTLQGLAADWGMSVPSLMILVLAIVAIVAVLFGYARTQWGYYLTGGLIVLFALMTYLGI